MPKPNQALCAAVVLHDGRTARVSIRHGDALLSLINIAANRPRGRLALNDGALVVEIIGRDDTGPACAG